MLLQPGSWTFFNTHVAEFFRIGTDQFLAEIAQLTIGGSQISGDQAFPITMLDEALAKVISTNMGVHLLAILFTPPYGFFYLILLLVALWSFLSLVFTGIWVYLTAMVVRAFLIGLAPIFILCFLFERTKHLFTGWVNQLFSTCLQPIMLFTFLSFFVLMILGPNGQGGLIDQVLDVPVCWTAAGESLQGSPFNVHYWRFSIPNMDHNSGWVGGFEPYGGLWDWSGPVDAPGNPPPFPIQLWPLLAFLVLAELGKRFSQMVLLIARELSSSSVDLSDMGNVFSNLMPSRAAAGGQGTANVGQFRQGSSASERFASNMANTLGR